MQDVYSAAILNIEFREEIEEEEEEKTAVVIINAKGTNKKKIVFPYKNITIKNNNSKG